MAHFLEDFITHATDTTHPSELALVIDTERKYRFATQDIIVNHGFKNLAEMEGKTIYDAKSRILDIADELHNDDLICLLNKSPTKSIFFGQYTMHKGFHLNSKTPIIDPTTKQICGAMIKIHKIDEPFIMNKVFALLINKCNTGNFRAYDYKGLDSIKLTRREQIILFLSILNYNLSDIANFVSKIEKKPIGVNLIRNNLNQQLYIKFGVSNINMLVEKAVHLSYQQLIPDDILEFFKYYAIQ